MPSRTSSTVAPSSSEGRSIPREWLFSMDHDRPEPHHERHHDHTHVHDGERKTFDDLESMTALRPPVRFGQRLKQLLRRPLFIANPTPSPLPTIDPNTPGYEAPFPLPTPAAQTTTVPTPAPAYPKSPQDASYFPPVADNAAVPNPAPNPSAWQTQPAWVVTPPGAPPTPGGAFIVTTQMGGHHAHPHATPIVLPPGKVTITLTLPSVDETSVAASPVAVTGPCACGDRRCVGGSLQTARERRRAVAACACGDSSCPAGVRRVHDSTLPPVNTSAAASASSSSSPAPAGPSSPLACQALYTCSPLSAQSRRVRILTDDTKDTLKTDKDEKRDRGMGRRAAQTDELGARRRRPSKAKERDMMVEVAFEPVH